MKPLLAIIFSIGLFAFCYYTSLLIHFDLTWIMVIGTALWAAIDSSKLQLKRYKSGVSVGPVMLFIACVGLWIIGFPWYLTVRDKIKNGTAVLKEPPPAADA